MIHNRSMVWWSKYFFLALLILGIVYFVGEELSSHLSRVEAWIKDFGVWEYGVFIALFVILSSLFVPESLLSAMAGALFGLKLGIAIAILSNLIAAAVQYALARHFFHSLIERMLAKNHSLLSISQAVKEDEVKMQFLLRFAPINPATLSYVFSLAGVKFMGFIVACISFSPHVLAEVYFGYAATYLIKMKTQDQHEHYIHDALILGGLVGVLIVLYMISKIVHKAIAKKIDDV